MKSPKKLVKSTSKSAAMPRAMVSVSDVADATPTAAGLLDPNKFSFPSPGLAVPVGAPPNVQVRFTLGEGYEAVKAGCYALSETPNKDDERLEVLNSTDSSDIPSPGPKGGQVTAVTVGLGATPAENNNKCAAFVKQEGAADYDETPVDVVEFRAYTQATMTAQVSAKYCMWFAWADTVQKQNGIPEGDLNDPMAGDIYRPIKIPIPGGTASIKIEADAMIWFSGSTSSNANGKTDDWVGLENPLYQNAALNSANIAIYGSAAPRYSLVAMLVGDAYDESAIYYVQYAGRTSSGEAQVIPVTGDHDKYLLLAFHEGANWANNDGEVNVTLTFNAT